MPTGVAIAKMTGKLTKKAWIHVPPELFWNLLAPKADAATLKATRLRTILTISLRFGCRSTIGSILPALRSQRSEPIHRAAAPGCVHALTSRNGLDSPTAERTPDGISGELKTRQPKADVEGGDAVRSLWRHRL